MGITEMIGATGVAVAAGGMFQQDVVFRCKVMTTPETSLHTFGDTKEMVQIVTQELIVWFVQVLDLRS